MTINNTGIFGVIGAFVKGTLVNETSPPIWNPNGLTTLPKRAYPTPTDILVPVRDTISFSLTLLSSQHKTIPTLSLAKVKVNP